MKNNKWTNGKADKVPSSWVRINHIDQYSKEWTLSALMPRKTAEKRLKFYICGKIVDDDNGGN